MGVFIIILLLFDFFARYSGSTANIVILKDAKRQVVVRDRASILLLLNKPFNIHVYSDSYVRGIQCEGGDQVLIDELVRLNENYYELINDLVAVAAMNGTLKCTLTYLHYESSMFDLQVEVIKPVREDGGDLVGIVSTTVKSQSYDISTVPEKEEDARIPKTETETTTRMPLKKTSGKLWFMNDGLWYSICAAVTVSAIFIAVIAVKVRKKVLKSAREVNASVDRSNDYINHVYEEIDYATCRRADATQGLKDVVSSISTRLPCPLPSNTHGDDDAVEYTTLYGASSSRGLLF